MASTLTITDKLYDGQGNPLAGYAIAATPTTSPVFLPGPDGLPHVTTAPYVSATTDTTGSFTLVLPWSAVCDPPALTWQIVLPDPRNTVWTGTAPSVAGPLTLDQLRSTYGWTVTVVGPRSAF